MKKEQILITGASGCVGQYIAHWLLENSQADLLLWLRSPEKLTAIDPDNPRVRLLIGDLRESNRFKGELSQVNRVIHTATAWGDPKRAYEVNIKAVKELLSKLDPLVLQQIIYFSTASILNKDLKPLPEAFIYGTEYIQTKAICLKELESSPLAEKIIAVFPTLVFGGKADGGDMFPTSYLTQGLPKIIEWLWLARWFKIFSSFHFIHAADIAYICGQLATNPHQRFINEENSKIRKLVLAQPSITINQAIKTLLRWEGMLSTPSIPLWSWLLELLVKVLPLEISRWDRFSIKQKHFVHDPITYPELYGGKSHAKSLIDVLINSGLKTKKCRKSANMR